MSVGKESKTAVLSKDEESMHILSADLSIFIPQVPPMHFASCIAPGISAQAFRDSFSYRGTYIFSSLPMFFVYFGNSLFYP